MKLLFTAIFCLTFVPIIVAEETTQEDNTKNTNQAPVSIELSEELVLDQRLIVLAELIDSKPRAIAGQLQPLLAMRESFNAAEQYVLLILEAAVAQTNKDFQQAVELIDKAHELEDKVAKKQLNKPLFAQSYLLLANNYVELKQFEKAYLAKRSYFTYYQNFSWGVHDKKVELLNEKYKTEQKLKSNELLTSQNKLKQLALKDSAEKNRVQQINTLLIIVLTVVFLLIFFRQLKVRKQLVLLAKTDSLTNLPNRRSLFERGEKLINNLSKTTPQLSVFVVDVDHFKKVNDQYGHDVGDKVLQKIAVFGTEVIRSRDVFARFGGEEFVAVLPDANLDEAKAISERLKEKVSDFDFSYLGIKGTLSISIGISTLSEELLEFEELLHTADLAMYQAKSSGRDQVVIYQKSMGSSINRVIRATH